MRAPSLVRQAALAVGIVVAALPALAQPPASAQGAVGKALAAPAEAKVAAPPAAPAVKAGAGGGPTSAPPAQAAGTAQMNAAVRSMETLWAPPTQPSILVPDSISRLTAELTTPDGRALTMSNHQLSITNNRIASRWPPSGPEAWAMRVMQEGERFNMQFIIGPSEGAAFRAPDVVFTTAGGTQTVALPGGGSLTLTLSEGPNTSGPALLRASQAADARAAGPAPKQ